MTEMAALPYDVSRCTGRMDMLPDGHWCRQRDTCQRYLAFSEWDRVTGIPDYRGIAESMAVPACENKIEVSNE